jgi:hypothetical protein
MPCLASPSKKNEKEKKKKKEKDHQKDGEKWKKNRGNVKGYFIVL